MSANNTQEDTPDSFTGVLRELECPVCQEFMQPPITMCQNGHNICKSCKPKLDKCPTCRGTILETRNISMENLARESLFPCTNKKTGCNLLLKTENMEQHHMECPYGNHKCPFEKISGKKCTWCGPLSCMKKHVKTIHRNEKIEFDGPFVSRCAKNDNGDFKTTRKAVFTLGELFYVVFKGDSGTFYCVIFHVGEKSDATKFQYRFYIRNLKETVSYTLLTRSFMEDVNEVFKGGNCISIHNSSLEKFLRSSKLRVKIEIFQCKPEPMVTSSSEDEEVEEEEEELNRVVSASISPVPQDIEEMIRELRD